MSYPRAAWSGNEGVTIIGSVIGGGNRSSGVGTGVLDYANAIKSRRIDHKRRMSCEHDLMASSYIFVDESKEVGLSAGVEIQARFVQENDHVRVLFELCECCDERNEPPEPVGSIIEAIGEVMAVIHHIQLQIAPQDARIVVIVNDRIDVDHQAEVLVLFPIVQDLPGEFGAHSLQLGLASVVVVSDYLAICEPHAKKGEGVPLPRVQIGGILRLERLNEWLRVGGSRQLGVFVEVEEPRNTFRKEVGDGFGDRVERAVGSLQTVERLSCRYRLFCLVACLVPGLAVPLESFPEGANVRQSHRKRHRKIPEKMFESSSDITGGRADDESLGPVGAIRRQLLCGKYLLPESVRHRSNVVVREIKNDLYWLGLAKPAAAFVAFL